MTLSGGVNPGGDPSQHNGGGLMDPNASMDDIPDLSIAVTEIGVIPPPPMFSSPSPPLPPPPPLTSNQVGLYRTSCPVRKFSKISKSGLSVNRTFSFLDTGLLTPLKEK